MLPKPKEPKADPWPLGWREWVEHAPDGTHQLKRIPLTEEDVLHPQVGDFIVDSIAHNEDRSNLLFFLQQKVTNRTGYVVLHHCRIDWGIEGANANGPDITVMENVGRWDRNRGTFSVKETGARPVLVIELTSPWTRHLDLDRKVFEYFRAGVPLYAIVDHDGTGSGRRFEVLGYRATPQGYARLELDERGRLWLEPVRLWLGTDQGHVACYNEHGRRLETYVEIVRRLEALRSK
jgi:Uma2 family endonuclease